MTHPSISSALRVARRALDRVDGVAVCGDWNWKPGPDKWAIHLRLTPDIQGTVHLPHSSDWMVLVDSHYPVGAITFYPAAESGITATFPHQHFNASGDAEWRRGDICLDDYLASLGRAARSAEPEDARGRLMWRTERALEWIRAAANDNLLPAGAPFELPDFPETSWSPRVVFWEGPDSYATWCRADAQWGTAELVRSPEVPNTIAVRRFLDSRNELVYQPSWGHLFSADSLEAQTGIWIRLNQVPVMPPWQAPQTWGELRRLVASVGLNVDTLLRPAARRIRDGWPHMALIGFPVPDIMAGPLEQMHWQAIELQPLCLRQQVPNGFRRNELGQWYGDRNGQFASSRLIDWRPSENWSSDELSSRGRLPQPLRDLTVALVGAGALGSAIAELLVRAGMTQLRVIDGDTLAAGNLVRHSLMLTDLDQPKAAAVAKRLNAANPNASIVATNQSFMTVAENRDTLEDIDLFIDTTGSNDVTTILGELTWDQDRDLVSMSISLGAKRLYLYTARGRQFPNGDFREEIEPLVDEDHEHYQDQLPWEGTGCWHPVFPARSDDIWLLAAASVKRLQRWLDDPNRRSGLTVIEQINDDEGFTGVQVR